MRPAGIRAQLLNAWYRQRDQVKDLAHAVAKVIHGVEISINKYTQPDKRSYRVDFSLFRELAPNRQPQVDLFKAVRGLKQGLEDMKFADANFRDSQYMRLKVLTRFREHGLLGGQLRWSQTGATHRSVRAG